MFTRNKSYVSYKGSLTTPPCTEGITWVLMTTMETISPAQLRTFQDVMASVRERGRAGMRTNNRVHPTNLQPHNLGLDRSRVRRYCKHVLIKSGRAPRVL
eukprot:jgi/Botrbrau1/21093/Bobra.0743s0001.1